MVERGEDVGDEDECGHGTGVVKGERVGERGGGGVCGVCGAWRVACVLSCGVWGGVVTVGAAWRGRSGRRAVSWVLDPAPESRRAELEQVRSPRVDVRRRSRSIQSFNSFKFDAAFTATVHSMFTARMWLLRWWGKHRGRLGPGSGFRVPDTYAYTGTLVCVAHRVKAGAG